MIVWVDTSRVMLSGKTQFQLVSPKRHSALIPVLGAGKAGASAVRVSFAAAPPLWFCSPFFTRSHFNVNPCASVSPPVIIKLSTRGTH